MRLARSPSAPARGRGASRATSRFGRSAPASVFTAVAAAAALAGCGGDEPAERRVPTATTEIERRDLVETETVDGTLGFADSRALPKPAGTVTWRPEPGATVRPGEPLLEVEGQPVLLLDGEVPAWRALGPGLEGDDVRQLERNLRELGHDDEHAMTVDGDWDAGTTAAVLRWQEAAGLDETGSVELGRVVFQPGPRRVTEDATTATRREIVVALETARAGLARERQRVTVTLPSGRQVSGRIEDVGRVAQAPAEEGGDATIDVTIRLRRAGGLDQAPVEVELERERRRDVLAIPVTALLAQSGGRYAVEIRDGGGARLVAVEPGLYASGYVEIAGDGLRDGQAVTNAEL